MYTIIQVMNITKPKNEIYNLIAEYVDQLSLVYLIYVSYNLFQCYSLGLMPASITNNYANPFL